MRAAAPMRMIDRTNRQLKPATGLRQSRGHHFVIVNLLVAERRAGPLALTKRLADGAGAPIDGCSI
jgi:hypothetical protein